MFIPMYLPGKKSFYFQVSSVIEFFRYGTLHLVVSWITKKLSNTGINYNIPANYLRYNTVPGIDHK